MGVKTSKLYLKLKSTYFETKRVVYIDQDDKEAWDDDEKTADYPYKLVEFDSSSVNMKDYEEIKRSGNFEVSPKV